MWLWWEGSGNYSGRACGCGGRGVGIIVGEHVVVVGGSGNYSGRACGCGGRGVGIIVGEHVVGGEWEL